MLVDDEFFNIMALRAQMDVLEFKNRHLVDECHNGEEAVDLIRKAIDENDPGRYSLILTDISMPFMDASLLARAFEVCFQPQRP